MAAPYKNYTNLKTWTNNDWVYALDGGGFPTSIAVGDKLTITGPNTTNGWRPGTYDVITVALNFATATPDGTQNMVHLHLPGDATASSTPLLDGSGNPAALASGLPVSGQVAGGAGYTGTAPAGALRVCAIGDSIVFQAQWLAAFQATIGASLKVAPAQILVNNRGIGGRNSTQWLPTVAGGGEDYGVSQGGAATGQSDLQAAIASANAANDTVFIVALGTNDSISEAGRQVSIAAYKSNIAAICAAIVAGCPQVTLIVLMAPFSPHKPVGGGGFDGDGVTTFQWDATSVAILPGYATALLQVAVADTTGKVKMGDTSLRSLFAANENYTDDKIHPNPTGGPFVGAAWGAAALGNPLPVPSGVAVQSVSITSPVPPALAGGGTLQLAAAVFPAGANQSVTWAATVYNADGTTAPGTISAGGLLTLPALANVGKRVVVTATGGNTFTTASIYVSPATVDSVTVFAPFAADGGTQVQLAAAVNGANAAGTGVTWGATLAGADGTAGAAQTISAGGLLTLPATAAANQTVTVTATSVMDTTKSGTATILVPATGDSMRAGDLNAQYAISKSLRGAGR